MSAQRVAIITGSSSGIGAGVLAILAERGWRVVVNYANNQAAAETLAARFGEYAIAIRADVANDEQCRVLAQRTLDQWGRIDALVNNAGATRSVPHGNLEELQAADFFRAYEMNVVAAFQMTRACAGALRAAHGAVVNISSVAARLGTGSSIAYAASKAALNTMTLSLARVLAPEVRVNAVCPGYTQTPWQTRLHGEQRAADLAKHYADRVPLKKAGSVSDIGETVAWLIEKASQITGETIYVDGGFHIAPPS